MPPDTLVALASSIHATPGAYAVLVGSGVSRAAGVMTGWEIAVDLARRVAIAEGNAPPSDPVAWYAEHHGEDPDYSRLLENLAPGTGDRQALLNGTVGDAFDNAVAESFFGALQLELLDRRNWSTRADLGSAIFEWIECFYNPQRRHSSVGMLSPVDYETTNAA